MTRQRKRHYIAEHIWRAARAILLLLAVFLWLYSDGLVLLDIVILLLIVLAHLIEQFRGYICNKIEKMLHWRQDFNDWE